MYRNLITQILKESYTPEGIEAWFKRPRSWLEGKTPDEVLENGSDLELKKLLQHAETLLGPGLAT